VKRVVASCGLIAVALALSCTSGDDVYITSTSNSALKAPAATCCTEFRVGGTVEETIGGGPSARVTVQAVATFAGLAATSVDELSALCRGLAEDLDVPLAKRIAVEAENDKRERMKAWCDVAASAISTTRGRAGGAFSVAVTAPVCSASVRAKAACQSRCSGGAACDAIANPPSCSQGRLTIACHGACSPAGSAPMTCTGSCSGACQGSCVAPAGVACAGPCDGLCKGAVDGGSGAGIQPDGTCMGTCVGTCQVTAPGAQCSGTCTGTCDAACTGPAGEAVTCDGACSGPADPISCTGGKVTGGCTVDPACDQSCDAIGAATAQCTSARITIAADGSTDEVLAFRLKKALEGRLPPLLELEARLGNGAVADLNSSGVPNSLRDIKPACILQVAAAALAATEDVSSTLSAAASVAAAASSL
jgi:hypothetical protein